MSDEYIQISAQVIAISRDAVLFRTPKGEGWCPRSVIHAASDMIVPNTDGAVIKVKVREWKARALGLI